MKNQEVLTGQYVGQAASDYEAKRQSSERWKREVEVFPSLLERAKPDSVIDCPVGTCRWAEAYARFNPRLIGMDISADMLAEAKGNAAKAGLTRAEFRQGNALAPDAFKPLGPVDLIVCVRFINWIDYPSAMKLVANLAQAESRRLIVGASVIPSSWGPIKTVRARIKLWLGNRKRVRKGLAAVHVHPEQKLEAAFAAHGLSIQEKTFIFGDAERANFFYLLEKSRS